MRTIALTVAYDGTGWYGLQRQSTLPSIQGALEEALQKVFQHRVETVCAGRTDAGVHAIAQMVSFPTDNPIPIDRIAWVTNSYLPATIRIRRAEEQDATFHARFSAVYRRYWYVVQTVGGPDPILGRFRWQISQRLNMTLMETALHDVIGRHDFRALCHRINPGGSTMRTIYHARVRRWRDGVIFDVQADAFLNQMMRLLVGNTILIGTGERPVTWLQELIHSRRRHLAGKGAPPHGLFLMRIGYHPTANPRWGSLLEKLHDEELLG